MFAQFRITGKRRWRLCGKVEQVVNLIRHDQKVIFAAELRQPAAALLRQGMPARILKGGNGIHQDRVVFL